MLVKKTATILISSREKVFVDALRFVLGLALTKCYSEHSVKIGKRIQTNSKGNQQIYTLKIAVEYSVEVEDSQQG